MRLPSYLFLLCLFACHHLPAAARLERRQEVPPVPFPDPSGYDVQPVAIGVADTGYSGFPNVLNADIVLDFELKVAPGASIPMYMSSNRNPQNITRAVISLPGKLRDNWYYFWALDKALYQAWGTYPDVDYNAISIMAPVFLNQMDIDAGAAAGTNGTLFWNGTTWMSGHYNIGPETFANISSYDVMDDLVDYYLNKTVFPNLDQVVIAGHSAGAQLTQRYAALRKSRKDDDRIVYWMANPGSLLWLTEDRPLPNDSCANVDRWKYGLTDGVPAYGAYALKHLQREGIVERYLSRNIHYAWGTGDDGPGDTRCQAQTQGLTHYQRGLNFVNMLQNISGGSLPANATVDFVEGVTHDCEGMTRSPSGLTRLFRNATYQDPAGFWNVGSSTVSWPSVRGLLLGAASTLWRPLDLSP
ncbi:hypothetical protein GGG16DRAFT_126468 [Schizophyllum commune]